MDENKFTVPEICRTCFNDNETGCPETKHGVGCPSHKSHVSVLVAAEENKPKKIIKNWINVLWDGTLKIASFHDTIEEAREELREYPKTLFATTEPQQIVIEDIWS